MSMTFPEAQGLGQGQTVVPLQYSCCSGCSARYVDYCGRIKLWPLLRRTALDRTKKRIAFEEGAAHGGVAHVYGSISACACDCPLLFICNTLTLFMALWGTAMAPLLPTYRLPAEAG